MNLRYIGLTGPLVQLRVVMDLDKEQGFVHGVVTKRTVPQRENAEQLVEVYVCFNTCSYFLGQS